MTASNKTTFNVNVIPSIFNGWRETTQIERHDWIKNRIAEGQSMIDCAGESVIPPHVKRVSLNNRTWEIVKLKAKVPFTNGNYRPMTGYGLIKDIVNGEELYVDTDDIKELKAGWKC